MPFVKIDCGILDSTLWLDRDGRDVFFTALLMAEPKEFTEAVPELRTRALEPTGWMAPPGWYGFVRAANVGIAHRARVDTDVALCALERLAAPEPDSRSQDFEGRRMIRVNGGFLILNYIKFRDRDYTAKDRQRRLRDRDRARKERRKVLRLQRQQASRVTTTNITQAEADLDLDLEKKDQAPIQDPGTSQIDPQGNGARARRRTPAPMVPTVPDTTDRLAEFPTNGTPHTWWLTRTQLHEWTALYPGLDVLAEMRKAYSWIRATPTRRKTAKGMPRFLVNWLNSATDKGPPRASGRVEVQGKGAQTADAFDRMGERLEALREQGQGRSENSERGAEVARAGPLRARG